MATEQNFSIRKGRTGTIVVTVTGVSIWTDLSAKLFASEVIGDTPVITLTGSIDAPNNAVTFTYTYNDTKDITASSLYYNVTIYKGDKTYIKDCNYGLINIAPVVKTDPTV